MQKGNYLDTILRSNRTVFTIKDITLLWQDSQTDATKVRLNYYVKKGSLFRIRRGLYAKSKTYNPVELATRIFTPSYVSFETVLAREGLIFQYQTQITVASYLTREIAIADQAYTYRKIKSPVLTNSIGIENTDGVSIAGKERAFLDTLYNNFDYYFDNLRSLEWEKVFEILPIYNNQRMTTKVNQLFKATTQTT